MSMVMDPNEVRLVEFFLGPIAKGAGDTITSADIIAPTGITVGPLGRATTVTPLLVRAWLTGGANGETYTIVCRATTSAGHVVDIPLRVRILDHSAKVGS